VRLVRTSKVPIVYKALTGGVIHYPGAFPGGLLTTVVGDELFEFAGRIRHTLCQFQEYVDKAYEIRLTVIGNTFFPVVISSQDMQTTEVDWRGENHLPYGGYRPLPGDIVDKVQRMLGELDIVYGAIDFIVTPSGEFVFLEINPCGQFMWMQHDLGLDMSGVIAELLTSAEPFRRGEAVQIGY
jgi:glutathione synthase/RimK-type ligase-like ATP-grasp enzyme